MEFSEECTGQWLKAFATQFMGGTFQSTAIEWAQKNLNQIPNGPDDKDPHCVLLNRFVEGIKRQDEDKREQIITPLIKCFEKNPEMVAHLRKEFRKPEKIQGTSSFEY